jgi:hypothetical protein
MPKWQVQVPSPYVMYPCMWSFLLLCHWQDFASLKNFWKSITLYVLAAILTAGELLDNALNFESDKDLYLFFALCRHEAVAEL